MRVVGRLQRRLRSKGGVLGLQVACRLVVGLGGERADSDLVGEVAQVLVVGSKDGREPVSG